MDIYTLELYNFLRTCTIKSVCIADQVKNLYLSKTGLDDLADEDNPYYLNMCGLYAPGDEPIYVESLDTAETVLFTKDLYLTHPRTAEKYRLPDAKFNELCDKYPTRKYFIQSIVYPVESIADAITAPDFSILRYDSSLLQENERDSLVQCAYDTVTMFKNNWYINNFLYADFYPVVMWSCLWHTLYMYLYLQRIKNIKTPQVHVSFIWDYLKSKGLKDYRSILTLDQQYWLYKNIDYIITNRGKYSTIRLLSENILRTYNVELRQKSVLLNYESGIEEPCPIPEVISEDMYLTTSPTKNNWEVYETIPEIIEREYDNNLRVSNTLDDIHEANKLFTRTTSTYHPTRVVEINKKLNWLEYETLYARFVIDNYIYRYSEGDLRFKINVELAGSNASKLLNPGECIALLHYCCYLQLSRVPADLPINIPTAARVDTAFKKGCNPNKVSLLFNNHHYSYVEKHLDELIVVPSRSYPTAASMMDFVDGIFGIFFRTSLSQRSSSDALLYEIIEAVYEPHVLTGKIDVTLVEGFTTYEDWFESSADLKNMTELLVNSSKLELDSFMVSIADKLFPSDTSYDIIKSDVILNDKYLKLKKLFINLCSYSISFLDTKDKDLLYFLDSPVVATYTTDLESKYIIPSTLEATVSNDITDTSSFLTAVGDELAFVNSDVDSVVTVDNTPIAEEKTLAVSVKTSVITQQTKLTTVSETITSNFMFDTNMTILDYTL